MIAIFNDLITFDQIIWNLIGALQHVWTNLFAWRILFCLSRLGHIHHDIINTIYFVIIKPPALNLRIEIVFLGIVSEWTWYSQSQFAFQFPQFILFLWLIISHIVRLQILFHLQLFPQLLESFRFLPLSQRHSFYLAFCNRSYR